MTDPHAIDLHAIDFHDAAHRCPPRPRTRFAPSPTGYLHLGHVVNAIYVWGVARALRGTVGLRIEDHDRVRSRPEFEAAILEDLDWLGFQADEGRSRVVRQSDRHPVYVAALDRLRAAGRVYACDCSRRTVGGERYAGTCQQRGLPEVAGTGLRVRLTPGTERFDDLLRGTIEQSPASEFGDVLVRDRDGHWTYQFAVTVDDLEQRIDLVIRGADLIASTGRQLQLARMLGRAEPPSFLHHPLIMRTADEKLSKSNRDTGVRELRAAGMRAAEVIGLAAATVGLTERRQAIEADMVASLFQG